MVTLHKIENSFGEVTEYEITCNSDDTKPLEYEGFPIGVNSILLELDTLKVYFLDDDYSWKEAGYNKE